MSVFVDKIQQTQQQQDTFRNVIISVAIGVIAGVLAQIVYYEFFRR